MTDATCHECAATVPRTAKWCGSCGARIERGAGVAGRRIPALLTLAAVAAVALLGGTVAAINLQRQPEGVAAPDEAPTVVDTSCDLDDTQPTCVSWVLDAGVSGTVATHGVIAIGRGGEVVGHDEVTGAERWRTSITTVVDGFGATPLMTVDGILIVNTELGGVTGLDPNSGELMWRIDGGAALPAAQAGLVVVRTQTGFVRGVTALTGAVVWERRLDDRVYPDVEVHADLVTALRPGGMQVFDRATGRPAWATNEALIDVHGVAVGGLVVSFAPSALRAEGRLAVFDVDDGRILWTRARAVGQQVAVGTDALFTQADNTPLERLAIADGTSEWNVGGIDLVDVPLDGRILSRGVPVMADRWLQLLDLTTGEMLQESRVGRDGITQLTIAADGELVATTPDGLHRFPLNGPTRAELDAVLARVLATSPLLVEASGRVVRVDDVEQPAAPLCTVGLRRAQCLEWSVEVDSELVVATDDHAVVVVSGALQSLSLAKGEVVWRTRVDADPTLVPVHADVHGVIASGRRTVSIDAATGDIRWTADGRVVDVEGLADHEVAVRRGDVVEIVGTERGTVRTSIDLTPGQDVAGIATTVALLTTTVDGAATLLSRDLVTGEVGFSRPLVAQQVHTAAGALYLAPHDDGGVYRHDPVTGTVVWGQPAGELVWSPTRGDEPWLVVQEVALDDAQVTALEPTIGAPLWTRTMSPLRGWTMDRSRGVFATASGIAIVDLSGDLVWQAAVPAPTLVGRSALLLVSDGALLRLRDPS